MGQFFRTINCSGISEEGRLTIAVGKTGRGYFTLWSGPEYSVAGFSMVHAIAILCVAAPGPAGYMASLSPDSKCQWHPTVIAKPKYFEN